MSLFQTLKGRQIAPRRSTTVSLREAKMVPDVTMKWRWHAAHLKRRRVVRSQTSIHGHLFR